MHGKKCRHLSRYFYTTNTNFCAILIRAGGRHVIRSFRKEIEDYSRTIFWASLVIFGFAFEPSEIRSNRNHRKKTVGASNIRIGERKIQVSRWYKFIWWRDCRNVRSVIMNLLLDTHILAWFHTEDKKLSSTAWDLIKDKRNNVFYSPISVSV